MNKKFVLLTFASMFLLSTLIGAQLITAVAAQPRIPGVNPGDWGTYGVTVSGNGTMPGMENITWAEITVQEIFGTNITFETRVLYANTTEETETSVVDVDTGQGNGTGLFIAADLNEGDPVYNSTDPYHMFYGMTINETISRKYAIGDVEVNHWNVTTSSSIPEVMNQTTSMDYCWHKSTGMMIELSMYYLFEQGGSMTWWEIKVLITGIIPEFPPALILPLFMIVTLAAVWLGKTMWATRKSIKKPLLCA